MPQQRVAFLSVSDKSGLEPMARALVERYGYTLLATGGTRTFLMEASLAVRDLSDITGFVDLLDGRVKSLHPVIFAGILADRSVPKHMEQVEFLIDTVVVNLYPFDRAVAEGYDKPEAEMRSLIDIGGSSLIRAAAKNYPSVNVLSNPEQYDAFLAQMAEGQGDTSESFRKKLALEAFRHSVAYDSAIAGYLAHTLEGAEADPLPESFSLGFTKIEAMRYGENPHQLAALYGVNGAKPDYEVLHGKKISYNNIVDMQAAWNIVTEFADTAACAIIKHNNPCGVAISARSAEDAYQTAFNADPLSAFGGIVGFNRPVDAATAAHLKEVFLELIVAPEFTPEALDILQSKKNLRLVRRPLYEGPAAPQVELKQVTSELFLLQRVDEEKISQPLTESLNVVSEKKPTPEQLADMEFAWKVAKHVKSNAIVVAKDGRTLGIGGGQTSRIAAMEQALARACDETKDAVVASDGFFPAVDNIHAAAQSRIGAIVQPGGSIKDADVLAEANRYGIAMATTGIREFKH